MNDLRWFAPSRLYTLPVPALRRAGLGIALDGGAPARVAVAADVDCAVDAFRFARRYKCPLVLYLWDLPAWRLRAGKPHPALEIGGRLVLVRRPWGGYPERSGYYSRIRYVASQATEVWCPSANTVEDVRRRFGIAAKRIPYCYDSVSRLVRHKNHAVILRAAARLTPRPLVRILGQGVEAGNLRRPAGELGVALDLTDTWASDDDVLAAYRAAIAQPPSRPAVQSPVLSALTIEACAARFLPGLQRMLAGAA